MLGLNCLAGQYGSVPTHTIVAACFLPSGLCLTGKPEHLLCRQFLAVPLILVLGLIQP